MLFRFISFVLLATVLAAQNKIDIRTLHSDYVLEKNRIKFREQLQNRVNSTFNSQPSRSNEKQWRSAMREVGLNLYKSEKVLEGITKAVKYAPNGSDEFQRSVIEIVYTLYPDKFRDEIYSLFVTTKDEQVFGTATFYLMNHPTNPLSAEQILNRLNRTFGNENDSPILKFLRNELTNQNSFLGKDELTKLLSHDFQKNKTIIYSIHRENRIYPGLTIIKKPDGKFVRNDDGTIFSVQQLALSVSNLPGYLSQGNTPQGIFSAVGFYVSPTESIGPTPAVITRIPFEVNPKIFYHSQNESSSWDLPDYKNLLPSDLQNYLPLFESYYAGQMGRRLIVMHGSTDDLSFYKNQPYYPLTPSKGCITAKEIWDEKTGKCLESDQAKLMNAYFSAGELEGFLVVINIDDKKGPVTIEELLPLIEKAETQ